MSKLAIHGGVPVRSRPFPKYPFYGPKCLEAITRVYEAQELCSQNGTETPAFEAEFAAWHGVDYAVAANNGTTALHMALAALDIGVGDEVLVPAYTFIATASAVVTQNAIPVLVDSETSSLGMDPTDMEAKITPQTKAVMPVHINGYPCDMDGILALARKHDLAVIEDCSHAHGALYHDRLVGTMSHIGVFSLQAKKNLSVGEGGIAITQDATLATAMKEIRHFSHRPMKYNYRLPEFNAAVGRAQLEQLHDMNKIRRANATHLISRLQGVKGITPLPGLPNTTSAYYNCMFQYDEECLGVPRGEFVKAAHAEGIPMNMFYYPLNLDSIMKAKNAFGRGCPFSCPLYEGQVEYRPDDNAVAARYCDRINVEIKVHPPCTEADMDDVAAGIRKVVENIHELASVEEAAS